MLQDRSFEIKSELRRLAKGDLLKMVFGQPEKSCILGGTCPFLLKYQQILFCVSEVLGQGCQLEKLRASLNDGEAEDNGHRQNQLLDWMSGPRLPGLE